MNPIVRARQDALQALLSEAEGLKGQESHSDAEMDRLSALPGEIRQARESLAEAVGIDSNLEAELASSGEFLNGGNVRSIGATASDDRIPDVIKNASRMSFDGRAGTELVRRNASGQAVAIDSEGWGISEKQARAISEPSYAKAFDRMMRGAADSHDIMSVLTEGNDSQGGFLAPPEFSMQVIMRKPHPTSILSKVTVVPVSRDRLIYPRVNYTTDDIYSSGVRIQWIGESGPTNDITDPAFGDVEIPVFTGQFPLEVSRNLLEDAAVPVTSLIQQLASQAFNLGMDNVVVNGTGVGQPGGILQNPGGTNEPPTVNIGNPVTADGLTELVYGLPPQYQDGSCALLNFTNAFMTYAKIKDSANHYVFGLQSTFDGGLATPRQAVLFGHQCLFSAFMPDGASAAKPIAFGDFSNYVLAQRIGLSVMPYGDQDRSMLRANKVGWLFRFRNGGDVVQPRAIRVGVQS